MNFECSFLRFECLQIAQRGNVASNFYQNDKTYEVVYESNIS